MEKNIVDVDLIRIFAATSVAIFHLLYWIGVDYQNPIYNAGGGAFNFFYLSKYTWFGWVGVEIFFVISGFVVAYTSAACGPTEFLMRRVLRLLPTVLICATLTLIAVMSARGSALTNGLVQINTADAMLMWLRSVTFFPIGPWIDPPYWTLPIEVFFYAIVFICVLVNRIRWLPNLMVVVGAFSTLWNVAVYLGILENSDIGNSWSQFVLLRHGCEFAIGVLLWRSIFVGFNIIYVSLLPIFIVGGCIEISGRAAWGFSVSAIPFDQPLVVPIVIWLIAIGALIASGLMHVKVQNCLKFKSLVRKIAIATFPFYLLHSFIGALLMRLLFELSFWPLMCVMVSLTVIAICSFIVSEIIEPLMRKAILLFIARLK